MAGGGNSISCSMESSLIGVTISSFTFSNCEGELLNLLFIRRGGSKFGTIASLQNGSLDSLTYLRLQNLDSASPTFNATFNMVMLNGSPHPKHTRF